MLLSNCETLDSAFFGTSVMMLLTIFDQHITISQKVPPRKKSKANLVQIVVKTVPALKFYIV